MRFVHGAALAALLCGSGFAEGSDSDGFVLPPRVAVATLLEQSIDDWEGWRDEQITLLLQPVQDEAGRIYIDIEAASEIAHAIQRDLEGCRKVQPGLFAESGVLWGMLRNLDRFTAAYQWGFVEGHGSGLSMSDREYEDHAGEAIAFPELLRSQEFLKAISDPATYRDAFEMIEARNASRLKEKERWKVLLFRSRFIKTSDDKSYGRFLVVVPDGDAEKWIQFGILTPEMDRSEWIHSVSVVGMRRTGRKAPRMESFVVDFWRDLDEATGEVLLRTRREAISDTGNCYACHKTPVIPIHPLEEYRFGGQGELVVKSREEGAGILPEELNAKIKGYGPAYFGGLLDVEGYGPGLGPEGRERGDELLRAIVRRHDLEAESVERIASAMSCSKCHHGEKMGALNFPMGLPSSIDLADLVHPVSGDPMPLVKVNVEEGWMPPENELSKAERAALLEALRSEYFDWETGKGYFVDWLRGEIEQESFIAK